MINSQNGLRSFREAHALTLRDVAGLSGISAGTLSKVETGKAQLAPLTKVRLAKALGVQVHELFPVAPVKSGSAA